MDGVYPSGYSCETVFFFIKFLIIITPFVSLIHCSQNSLSDISLIYSKDHAAFFAHANTLTNSLSTVISTHSQSVIVYPPVILHGTVVFCYHLFTTCLPTHGEPCQLRTSPDSHRICQIFWTTKMLRIRSHLTSYAGHPGRLRGIHTTNDIDIKNNKHLPNSGGMLFLLNVKICNDSQRNVRPRLIH